MTRALLTGCLIGLGLLGVYTAGVAQGIRHERAERRKRALAEHLAILFPAQAHSKPYWEPTSDGLWRLREGGAL